VYVTRSVRVVDNLKTILAPVLPHTAQQLHEYLGHEGQLFGTQQVVEYEEETRCHQALTYDHSGAVGTWSKSELPPGHPRGCVARRCASRRRCSRSGTKAWWRRSTRGWEDSRSQKSRGLCPGSFSRRLCPRSDQFVEAVNW
jgi:hypothetical protein